MHSSTVVFQAIGYTRRKSEVIPGPVQQICNDTGLYVPHSTRSDQRRFVTVLTRYHADDTQRSPNRYVAFSHRLNHRRPCFPSTSEYVDAESPKARQRGLIRTLRA
jgi:hypothetical protein